MKILITILCLIVSLSGCVGVNRSGISENSYKLYKYSQRKKDRILVEKGNPDQIVQISEGKEKWVYQHGTHFEGVVFWLVFPIPLVYPSGSHAEEYLFEGEKLLLISTRSHSSSGIVYGCYPSGTHGVIFIDCGKVPFR